MLSSNFIFRKQLQSVRGQNVCENHMDLHSAMPCTQNGSCERDQAGDIIMKEKGTHHLPALENLPVQGMKTVCKADIFLVTLELQWWDRSVSRALMFPDHLG